MSHLGCTTPTWNGLDTACISPQIASDTGMHGLLIYLFVYNISRCYPVNVGTGIPLPL